MFDIFTNVEKLSKMKLVKKMTKKKDLRVIKTENLLYTTLMELLKEKSFEEIKVSDICNKALINRSTFYAHYNDKYELLMEFINSLKESLREAIKDNEKDFNTKEYYLKMIELVLIHIEEQKDIYSAVLINNRNSIVMDIFLDVINHDVNEKLAQDNFASERIPSKVISTFYIGAVISLCMEWLKNSNKYTIEEIMGYIEALIPDNIGN